MAQYPHPQALPLHPQDHPIQQKVPPAPYSSLSPQHHQLQPDLSPSPSFNQNEVFTTFSLVPHQLVVTHKKHPFSSSANLNKKAPSKWFVPCLQGFMCCCCCYVSIVFPLLCGARRGKRSFCCCFKKIFFSFKKKKKHHKKRKKERREKDGHSQGVQGRVFVCGRYVGGMWQDRLGKRV